MNTSTYRLLLGLCVIILSSSGCFYHNDFNPYRDLSVHYRKKNPDPTLAVEAQFLDEMQKRGFSYVVHNLNEFCNCIHELGYWFDTDNLGFSSTSEARAFIIGICEDLLKKFNDNEKVRPYLTRPFNARDLSFRFTFTTNKQSSSPEIGAIFVCKGEVTYRRVNFAASTYKDYKESYEEAKRLYDEEQKEAKERQESDNESREQVDTSSLSFAQLREGQTL